MIFLKCDYGEGAHPRIWEALMKTNMEQCVGYSQDPHSRHAAELIKARIGRPDADIHFLVGGTQTNFTTICSVLRPHEAVISPGRGHICMHETGSVESRGHKVIHLPSVDSKIRAEQIDECVEFHADEHFVKPKLVYISQPTELGAMYTKAELLAIREKCDKHGLYLYIDGARLAVGLTCEACDTSLEDIANIADAFYIGGTKIGMLFGEAVVLLNDDFKKDFRFIIKQNGGMLAKGWLLGAQFEEMFKDDLYFELGKHANEVAKVLRDGLTELGVRFSSNSPTNQLFMIIPNEKIPEMDKYFIYEDEGKYDEGHRNVRFCTSWATPMEDAYKAIEIMKEIF